MKQAAKELAMLLKSRNNKSFESVVIGKVISVHPLKINDGDDIMLDEELIITNTIRNLINANQLTPGNNVYMTATADYSQYVVVDKVVS